MCSTRAPAAVIVLGYGAEEDLGECLSALLDQVEADDELILVDNGIADAARREPGWSTRIRLVRPTENLGFAGGTAYAASMTSRDVLVFVNSDAIVRPGGLDAIIAAATGPDPAFVGGCLRLADEPDLINSAGNPLHFTGVTWAGHCGDPAVNHSDRRQVAVATGGFCAISRRLWDAVGGFDPIFFAYHEDTDLSIRTRLAGHRVEYVPDAVADHYYDFGRSPLKMYLVERNRLMTVLTDFPTPLLMLALPAVVVLEPAFFALAVRQGWARQKVDGWRWLLRHRSELRERRARIQAATSVSDPTQTLMRHMTATIEPPMVEHPPGMHLVNRVLRGYWRGASRAVDRRRARVLDD
jgi:GT2 family glycosyltransferase